VRVFSLLPRRSYLRKNGVLVRYFGTQGGQLQNFVRISAGYKFSKELPIASYIEY
jgi:histidinol-phosphate/aromatic aminotransferase/cobyric acid decarboxylase-like protein